MKKIFIPLIAMALSTGVVAQELSDANLKNRQAATAEVESGMEIKTSEEFLQMYNWLMETPITEQEDKRSKVSASISKYIEENPEVDIDTDIKLLKFSTTSPELLPVFMGGYAKYVIENNDQDPENANMAGVMSIIEYYQKNEQYLEKDKNIEKFIKMQEKEKLERFVQRKS